MYYMVIYLYLCLYELTTIVIHIVTIVSHYFFVAIFNTIQYNTI